jgi:hypothetical protein
VFDAFNENSETWEDGSRWFARSSCNDEFVVEGIVQGGQLVIVAVRDGQAHTPAGIIKSYKHLISETTNGNVELLFANYRTTMLTVEHTCLSYNVYSHASGKQWAINLRTGKASDKVVVLFKNENTLDKWVLYENSSIDLSTPKGLKLRDQLLASKLTKRYQPGGLFEYNDLIKL